MQRIALLAWPRSPAAAVTRRRRWQGGVGRVHIKQGGVCCDRCDTELKLVCWTMRSRGGVCRGRLGAVSPLCIVHGMYSMLALYVVLL